jgi:hypothetical protein
VEPPIRRLGDIPQLALGDISKPAAPAPDDPGARVLPTASSGADLSAPPGSALAGQPASALDPNALVQQVLRESYLQTTEDLRFYAEKLEYFDEQKQRVRAYLEELRQSQESLSEAMKEGFGQTPRKSGDLVTAMVHQIVRLARSSIDAPPLVLGWSARPGFAGGDGGATTSDARAFRASSSSGAPNALLLPVPSDMFSATPFVDGLSDGVPAAPPGPPAGPVTLDQINPNAFAISFAHSGALAGAPAFGPPGTATQAAGGQLDSFVTTGGSPGSQINIARGTAQSPAAETGGDSLITWGRWTGGTTTGTGAGFPVTFGPNQGFHYVVGAATPPANLPASGTATFTLMGATKPTFTDGALAPGTFTGSVAVQWGGAATTKVGVDFNITMPGDASYRLMSAGGVVTPGTSLISTSVANGSAFTGPANVTVTGTGRACPGACSGNVNGFFAGPNAERAGAAYMIGVGATSIQGAAAFTR